MRHDVPVRAQVVVLAGPSGAGKSRVAARLGLPVLRLDDFYRSGGDPALPRIADGPNAGLVDWDHPDSWLRDEALAALDELCRTGAVDVPVYELAKDGRTGWQRLDLGGHRTVVAEGIFAADVVEECRERGLLAAAVCVTQHPAVTFWRRLTRDLREHRKPPLVLLRRGLDLMRHQREVVADAVAVGCEPMTGDQAIARLAPLAAGAAVPGEGSPAAAAGDLRALEGLVQPDGYTCGAATVVAARALRDPAYAASLRSPGRWRAEVLAVHREVRGLVDPVAGRAAVPWPRLLGTPPWAVARRLTAATGRRWRTARPRTADLRAALDAGAPVPLFVGSRLLPRHVVLAVGLDGRGPVVWDPAVGRTRPRGELRWPVTWAAVLPR